MGRGNPCDHIRTKPRMTRPLTGTLVLSLDQAVAAPMTSRKLADAGARVIKLERPEGDFARHYDSLVHGECTHFAWLNRGKESAVVDLGKPDDKRLFEAILAKADVLLQNLKPGALAKLGYATEALHKRHPRLICCSISGYGDDGPFHDRKAYDLLVQAESGLASVTGRPSSPSRTTASGWCSAPRSWSSPSSDATRALPATPPASPTEPKRTRSRNCASAPTTSPHCRAAWSRPRSPSPASTISRPSCAIRTCGASPSTPPAAPSRCPRRRPDGWASRTRASAPSPHSASTPPRCDGSSWVSR